MSQSELFETLGLRPNQVADIIRAADEEKMSVNQLMHFAVYDWFGFRKDSITCSDDAYKQGFSGHFGE
jgi:hypothetical protein